jgi:hypothetical protein
MERLDRFGERTLGLADRTNEVVALLAYRGYRFDRLLALMQSRESLVQVDKLPFELWHDREVERVRAGLRFAANDRRSIQLGQECGSRIPPGNGVSSVKKLFEPLHVVARTQRIATSSDDLRGNASYRRAANKLTRRVVGSVLDCAQAARGVIAGELAYKRKPPAKLTLRKLKRAKFALDHFAASKERLEVGFERHPLRRRRVKQSPGGGLWFCGRHLPILPAAAAGAKRHPRKMRRFPAGRGPSACLGACATALSVCAAAESVRRGV